MTIVEPHGMQLNIVTLLMIKEVCGVLLINDVKKQKQVNYLESDISL